MDGYEDANSLLKMQYETVKLKLAAKSEALVNKCIEFDDLKHKYQELTGKLEEARAQKF